MWLRCCKLRKQLYLGEANSARCSFHQKGGWVEQRQSIQSKTLLITFSLTEKFFEMSNQSNASCKHFQMSCEQEKIIECDADSIKINAFAGCGKSTVLKGYAKKRPSKRYLYLAYNKPIADSASSSFPKNVKCKTTHSLAFEAVGVHYASIDKIGESRASTVQKILGVSVSEAASIQKTVSNFLSSSAP